MKIISTRIGGVTLHTHFAQTSPPRKTKKIWEKMLVAQTWWGSGDEVAKKLKVLGFWDIDSSFCNSLFGATIQKKDLGGGVPRRRCCFAVDVVIQISHSLKYISYNPYTGWCKKVGPSVYNSKEYGAHFFAPPCIVAYSTWYIMCEKMCQPFRVIVACTRESTNGLSGQDNHMQVTNWDIHVMMWMSRNDNEPPGLLLNADGWGSEGDS